MFASGGVRALTQNPAERKTYADQLLQVAHGGRILVSVEQVCQEFHLVSECLDLGPQEERDQSRLIQARLCTSKESHQRLRGETSGPGLSPLGGKHERRLSTHRSGGVR